ncbi:MAG: bifunctional biotin--[acetyl-CoA-carboxylase] ligase/biotin operon repressor BirA [Gammaproteobacteria bacterium]|nr:bifunctional biotin--[acetyl-CoA-carboxylase] ligase/biotin operon repressor BirA [Gammaproteobacteria bacterium]
MVDPIELLRLLADGAFYSGQKLATQYGVSRMTIHHSMHKLTDFGIIVYSVRGRGYRLAEPLELLDSECILAAISQENRKHVTAFEIFPKLDSTNSYLLRQAGHGASCGHVCLAEYQSEGKGRRGRRWVSPFARNLYLSLLWRFENGSFELSGLSLLIGLAVAKVIRDLGVTEVGLKWPNDIVWRDQKLGGILVEVGGELGGRCHMAVGVGINVVMPLNEACHIDQPWTDMAQVLAEGFPSRNELAAKVIESMMATMLRFERQGLDGLVESWRAFDCLYGKPVSLHLPKGILYGTAWGIDGLGRLRLVHEGKERVYASGEISLRRRP